jgi:hypothetical protein
MAMIIIGIPWSYFMAMVIIAIPWSYFMAMIIIAIPWSYFILFCSKASVYGKRDGFMHGLAVVSREMPKNSIFRGTRGWKTGTIHDVEMLGRASMWKPEVPG